MVLPHWVSHISHNKQLVGKIPKCRNQTHCFLASTDSASFCCPIVLSVKIDSLCCDWRAFPIGWLCSVLIVYKQKGCMHQEVVTTWYSYSFSDTTVILCPQQAHEKKKNTETAQTHGFLWKSGTPKSCDPQWIIIGCLRAIFWPADPKALWGSQWAPKRHHRLRKWVGYPWRPGKMCGTFDGET